MIPVKKNDRGVWLTALGLVTATSAIVITSECTTTESSGGSRQPATATTPTTAAWLAAPATPPAIAPPPGATVTAHFKATGAQIYRCGPAAAPATYGWTLQAPDAKLLDADGVEVGSHAAGPTWRSSKDGSSVAATKVAQADATAPGAIPWLLLRASTTTPGGVFSPVTFIQRVNTSGGQAPAAGCDAAAAAASATTRVAYTADYIFFKSAAVP